MKKILLILLVLSISLGAMTSCSPPNTVSTNTEYHYVMIGGFEDPAENTLYGAAWRGIKKLQSETFDGSKNDGKETIKYYPLHNFSGNDTLSYADARTAAAKKQLELAAAGKAQVIVIPDYNHTAAYKACVGEKAFKDMAYVLFSYPSTEEATGAATGKTYVLVLDTTELGYLIGTYAYQNGYKNLGLIATSGAEGDSLLAGLAQGLEFAAKDAKDASLSYVNVEPGAIAENINAAVEKLSSCDAVLSSADIEKTVSDAVKNSGGKFISANGSADADMTFGFDLEIIEDAVVKAIKEARLLSSTYVYTLGSSSNAFYRLENGEKTNIALSDVTDELFDKITDSVTFEGVSVNAIQ